jgi:tetratricopeptide (TPR) repeat protein
VSFDRAATLRQAEKLLRQGKLEQAIEAYQTLVEDQPRDWTVANQFGDVLTRAGRVDEAVAQYTRIADAFAADGFRSKAAAVYKKILKLAPHNAHATWQAGEMAAAQGLVADARAFFRAMADQCRSAGDTAGVARATVRMGELDPADVPARLAGARARVELGNVKAATGDLTQLSQELLDEGREEEAVQALGVLLQIEPGHGHARATLARVLVGRGDMAAARPYLTADVLEHAPELALPAAEVQLRAGDTVAAAALLDRILYTGDPEALGAVSSLAARLAADLPDLAFKVAEQATDASILRNDWPRAAQTLLEFAERAPGSVPALTRLVEVCVDGGLASELDRAQARLVDAYLAAGATAQARYVAEDLASRAPADRAHRARLVQVLAAAGEAEPERAADEWLTAAALTADVFAGQDEAARSAPPLASPALESVPSGSTPRPSVHAIDLSGLLGEAGEAGTTPASTAAPPDIEQVFAGLRDRVGRAAGPGEVDFQRGRVLFEAGDLEASIEPLRSAARDPGRRFAAASLLARVFHRQRREEDAIEWLGHAADAPVDDPADRHRVLLQLADVLERSGEGTRALGVCLELQADAGDFGDVAARIERLSRGHE